MAWEPAKRPGAGGGAYLGRGDCGSLYRDAGRAWGGAWGVGDEAGKRGRGLAGPRMQQTLGAGAGGGAVGGGAWEAVPSQGAGPTVAGTWLTLGAGGWRDPGAGGWESGPRTGN